MTRRLLAVVVLLVPTSFAMAAKPNRPDAKGVEFFEKKVRPVLAANCYECHSTAAKKSGLALDSKESILHGGEHGPAVLPGKPAESPLIKAINHDGLKMPVKGPKLAEDVIDDLTQWVAQGAAMPDDPAKPAPLGKPVDVEAGRRFRSFQPLGKFEAPAVKNAAAVLNPIDRFVQAKLEEKGLSPAAPAGREQLIRRAYFDLIGLPPKPEEIDAFLNDTAPGAWERLIDRLLASDHYGERWARHWLDVARYAESGGYEFDKDRPGAFHYRDFVIRALNADMPYDEFVKLQLAGDKLKPGDLDALAATGFIVAGPYPGQTTAKTIEIIRYDQLDDMVSTTANAVLGLTLACARCHEHKYDPIPQEDYYRLTAAFAKTTFASPKVKDADGKEVTLYVAGNGGGDVQYLIRGEVARKNGVAKPGFLQVLSAAPETRWNDGKVEPRVALASWITDAEKGAGHLAARVIVNRLWQHHFGEGIVATPNDFGSQGDPPSHPELLDWLAAELIRGGWRLKPIHKLMMSSASYQRGSGVDPAAVKADPDNRLIWRHAPDRLEAEVLRDALLAVGGNLDERLYGPGAPAGGADVQKNGKAVPSEKPGSSRRSIYLQVRRSKLDPLMALFDAPDGAQSIGKRPETTVASQALALMNSPFVRGQAARLAQRVQPSADANLPKAIEAAYRIALGRKPLPEELEQARAFIEGDMAERKDDKNALLTSLGDFCLVLLCSNEFVYVD